MNVTYLVGCVWSLFYLYAFQINIMCFGCVVTYDGGVFLFTVL